jgi:molecular chaperone HscB
MSHPALERPNTNNYFQFYGLEESFDINPAELKKCFLDKSRKYHPDFYGDNAHDQNIAIATSSYNNLAFKTLSKDISRAQYLVALNLDKDDETPTLPQSFLMEMMELNEAIDDMTESASEGIKSEISEMKNAVQVEISNHAKQKNWQETQLAILKWKYLQRLFDRMD